MANLTLSIDGEVLHRARIKAATQRTSVNAVVRRLLEAYAGADAQGDAWERLVNHSKSVRSGSGPNGRGWARDDLHER